MYIGSGKHMKGLSAQVNFLSSFQPSLYTTYVILYIRFLFLSLHIFILLCMQREFQNAAQRNLPSPLGEMVIYYSWKRKEKTKATGVFT